jgi:murein DD-endopeptidase MepM/ murein hydrolase activator NlpD
MTIGKKMKTIVKSPVGTEEERNGYKIYPGFWIDVNPFLNRYYFGYHTGSDLNLNKPKWDSDKGAPVFPIANGKIIYSGEGTGTWGNIIVIEHFIDNNYIYSRYGHVENLNVIKNEYVNYDDQIAMIGKYKSKTEENYHLHFDIVRTDILINDPCNWPGWNKDMVINNYLDPKKFLIENILKGE